MDNQPQPTTPPPVAPTPEPIAPQAPASDPNPVAPESPKANGNKGIILALVAVAVIALVVVCYFLFLRPKPAENKEQTTPPANQQQTQENEETATVGTTIEDERWNITFPGYTVGEMIVYNETMSFLLPEGVTDVTSSIVDLTNTPSDTFTVSINGITTTTGVYDGTTICGYGETAAPITLAKYIRQPISMPAPEVNGTSAQEVIEHNTDEIYNDYLQIGLEDQVGACELNSAKYDEAKALVKALFGLETIEE